MPPQWLPIYYLWAASGTMAHISELCSGFRRALAPLGKAVFKGRRRRIQAASGRFRARLEGCVQSRLKSLLVTQSKKQAAFEPIIHPRTRRAAQWRLGYGAVYAETRGRLKRASRADRQHQKAWFSPPC